MLDRIAWAASLGILGALLFAGCTAPEEARARDEGHVMLQADDVAWTEGPASLPAGAKWAVLAGDPASPGPFTMRLQLPAEYAIPPHTHPVVERVTVLEGSGHVGMGATLDRAAATALTPGSFFVMQPGMQHYFFTGAEPVTLQLHGTGPWGITYVDPADDPRAGPEASDHAQE